MWASKGYIYCLSNPSMPGLLKIGMTERTPEERLREANKSDTFRPPTEYKIEIKQRVYWPRIVERKIHTFLRDKRVNPRREFFRAELDEVRTFFKRLGGERWKPRAKKVPKVVIKVENPEVVKEPEAAKAPEVAPLEVPTVVDLT